MGSSGEAVQVQVAIRIRPLVKSEVDKGCRNIIGKVPDLPQILVGEKEPFTFNYVFTPENSQDIVYESCVKNLVGALFDGYNVTVLAYGQTGSGKTHTMGTAFDGGFDTDVGVIPRAMHDIFERIKNMPENDFKVSCSFMELYKEQLYDLLSTTSREQSVVELREDNIRNVVTPGLTQIRVASAQETTHCLVKGSSGRAVAATAMNAQSSRSHAIFSLNIEITKNHDSSTTTTSKFQLVDLAGSERPKKTETKEERFKEGVSINKGLLALGNVISALGSAQSSGSYVGYRDSKLTRLLQDSLGGNSKTLMIACVSPADYNMEETLSTLRYADRAKKIRNKPIVNRDPQMAEINRLKNIIQDLRLRLLNYEVGSGSDLTNDCNDKNSLSPLNNDKSFLEKELKNLNEKYVNVQQQFQALLDNVADNELNAIVYENSHEELVKKFSDTKLLITEKLENSNHAMDLKEQKELFDSIRNFLQDYDTVLQKNCAEILNGKNWTFTIQNTANITLDSSELAEKRIDAFNNKQLGFTTDLNRINREINIKQNLHEQMVGNLNQLTTYDANTSKCIEFESMIKTLEAERDELIYKLKYVNENASVKLAEERRKRLQQLEKQINDLKKQNLNQAKMLKVKEKDSQKVLNLNNEIQAMKAAKVKLIQTMKQESGNFRQWKLHREQEFIQLQAKDRKRQNEMARMESLHIKQKGVLKRKFEECMAVNKKLKDALEKQRVTQIQRKTNKAGKYEQIDSWVYQEVEVILSVVDAQILLDHLMEDRAALNTKHNEMMPRTCSISETAKVVEEIETINAQINDLQQKILENDIEAKVGVICNGLCSISELRSAVKHLFSIITDMRKDFSVLDSKFQDLRTLYTFSEEIGSSLEKDLKEMQVKYTEEKTSIQKHYEEKISVLLRELNQSGISSGKQTPERDERIKIQENVLSKTEKLSEQLSKKQEKKSGSKRLTAIKNDTQFLDMSATSEEEEHDNESDPDWRNTPISKRRPNINVKIDSDQAENLTVAGVKRRSDGSVKCNCKGDCITQICSCRKSNCICTDKCKCSLSCLNSLKNAKDESNVEIEQEISPKKTRVLEPSTPTYPYSIKPRKPFFN